jgi:predicted N-acyltransferase
MTDDERFAWLEQQAKKSQTGISFDWVPAADGEPKGWRFMRRFYVSTPHASIRSAIDHAMALGRGDDRLKGDKESSN